MPPSVALLCNDEPSSRFLAAAFAAADLLKGIVLEQGTPSGLRPPRLPFLQRAFGKLYQIAYYESARSRAQERLIRELAIPPGFPPVPLLRHADINSPEVHAFLKGLAPDVLCVWGTWILKPETIALARRVALNGHLGVLPDYRGSASEFWALYEGRQDMVGWTIHRVTPELDRGPIFAEGRIPANAGQDEWDLRRENIRALAAGWVGLLKDLDGTKERPQEEGRPPRRHHTPWQHARLHGRLHLWGFGKQTIHVHRSP